MTNKIKKIYLVNYFVFIMHGQFESCLNFLFNFGIVPNLKAKILCY